MLNAERFKKQIKQTKYYIKELEEEAEYIDF